jgi:hypothetical protein
VRYGFVTVEIVDCKSTKGMFKMSDIDEKIAFGNGNSMTTAKVGSRKRHVVPLDGSVLDITINKVRYVPKL